MRAGTQARPPGLQTMAELLDPSALRKHCTDAFQNADSHRKGFLTKEDYKVAIMELLGYKPSKYELESIWTEHVGCHGEEEGGLDREAFTALITHRLMQKDIDELVRQIFVSFDVYLNGFLTLESCQRVFHEVAPLIKTDQIERWFREMDIDNDGRVTYRDFELMIKSHTLLYPSHLTK